MLCILCCDADLAIQTRTQCLQAQCCVLITNIFIFAQLFQSDCRSFTSRKL